MDAYALNELFDIQKASGQLYHEFIRVPALSVGIYRLPAGSQDPQSPHNEDEVYYVIDGEGMIHVDGEDQLVKVGMTIYVGAHITHYFHTITEDLTILVFFAPAETE